MKSAKIKLLEQRLFQDYQIKIQQNKFQAKLMEATFKASVLAEEKLREHLKTWELAEKYLANESSKIKNQKKEPSPFDLAWDFS